MLWVRNEKEILYIKQTFTFSPLGGESSGGATAAKQEKSISSEAINIETEANKTRQWGGPVFFRQPDQAARRPVVLQHRHIVKPFIECASMND